MSQLELIGELRGCRPAVSPALRDRIDAIVASAERPRERRRVSLPSWPLRRIALVAAPATVAVVAVGAVAFGLASPGTAPTTSAERNIVHGEKAPPPHVYSAVTVPGVVFSVPPTPKAADTATGLSGSGGTPTTGGGGGSSTSALQPVLHAGAVPVQPGRAQVYGADIALRVRDLSLTTKKLLRMTRGYGGYVRSVDYGEGAKSGTAYVVVRIPIGSVQAALVRFTSLGAILTQHVSIQDVQQAVDQRFRRMQALRKQIAAAQKRKDAPAVRRLQAELLALEKVAASVHRETSYATVAMELTTKKAAVVAPPAKKEGRLQRGIDRAGAILSTELIVLLYVAIVGIPVGLIVAAFVAAARLRRRRGEDRLLAEAH